MKDFEYKKPLLEEADFGKFVAGNSGGAADGDAGMGGVDGGRG